MRPFLWSPGTLGVLLVSIRDPGQSCLRVNTQQRMLRARHSQSQEDEGLTFRGSSDSGGGKGRGIVAQVYSSSRIGRARPRPAVQLR